ncbi:MAG TPA: hypothetical protein VMJ11_06580 [Paraburkholderia sp.]|uniref:hypothetical protein n=1 Tax=Paraburkholderia sp. TaxID=1926495 RepID=UPI002BD9FC70|nr:hypothetical protein [Paraburkholderia sp.]HTR06314.1 hypothetical protein [Paraburkholderia sp.]
MFNREDYLNDEYVEGFVAWLSKILAGDIGIAFSTGFPRDMLPDNYGSRCRGRLERDAHGAVYVVKVDTLEQLFGYYWWGRDFYDGNKREVDRVREVVQQAIAAEDSESALELTRRACRHVMDWGFGRGTRASESNVSWAMGLDSSLVQVLRNGREALLSDVPDLSVFGRSADPSIPSSKMNSGWTKYYSFALPAHVIYDSRVGAALCFLVRRYLEALSTTRRVDGVPASLAFRWAPGQAQRVVRDPSRWPYRFARLLGGASGSREWARVNIQANWILAAAIEKAGASWCSGADGFRRVEGALFLLGYDLSRAGELDQPAGAMAGQLALGIA